jgi:integrase
MPASTAKIPYIQRVKSRDGKVRLYFRKGDHREGPLSAPDGSDELREEVEAIVNKLAALRKKPAVIEGTVGGMLLRYAGDGDKQRPCAEFLGLASSTQAEYLRMATEIREDCGEVLLSDVTVPWLRDLRDAWAPQGYKAANDRRQVLKNALAPAIEDGRLTADPFAKIGKLARPHDAGEAHPAWEDHEFNAAVADALGRNQPGLARAYALARWGGFRRGTICRIPLNARALRPDLAGVPQRRLQWITEKRKVLCDKREDARLSELLDETPNRALTIAYNADGFAWKPRQLAQAVERHNERLAKAGKVRLGLSLHGLRHSRGVELAEAGASDAEIMSQLEHATDRAARIYRRQAERRRLADSGQDRIDSVIAIRSGKSDHNGG